MSRGTCKIIKQKKAHQASIHARASAALLVVVAVVAGAAEAATARRRGRGAAAAAAARAAAAVRWWFRFWFFSEEVSEERLSRGVGCSRAVCPPWCNRRGKEERPRREVDDERKQNQASIVGDNEKKTPFSFLSSCKVVVPSSAPPVATTDPKKSPLAPPAEQWAHQGPEARLDRNGWKTTLREILSDFETKHAQIDLLVEPAEGALAWILCARPVEWAAVRRI